MKDNQLGWQTSPALWNKLKPLARQMRHDLTPAEKHLWQALRNRKLAGAKFRRQHSPGRFVVDSYCAAMKLVVEIDGPIHDYTAEEDAIRDEYLESLGLHVLRFPNQQVTESLGKVLARIEDALGED